MSRVDWLIARPIAHRGYHDRAAGRIENSLAAAEAAVAHNFAIECDLQPTADGKVVVFHDDDLDRLTDAKGPVAARTLADLSALRLTDSNESIPTFEDLLDTVNGRVPLLVELKSRFKGDRRLEQAVAPILAGYRGPAALMSFDPMSMIAMRRLLPQIPRGMTADAFNGGPDWQHVPAIYRFAFRNLVAAPAVGPSFVSYGITDLPAFAPLALHRLGVRLITWTIHNPADRAKSARYADQITFEGFDPDTAP